MGQPVPKGGGGNHIGEPYQIAGVQDEPKADPAYSHKGTATVRVQYLRRASLNGYDWREQFVAKNPIDVGSIPASPKVGAEKQKPRAVVARASPHRQAGGGREPSGQQAAKPSSDDKSLSIQAGSLKAACYGVNAKTGKRQSVQQIYKTGISHNRRFFAEARHDGATGRPLIVYYRRYATAPGYFKSFIRAHECCHHSGNQNEIAANCCALRRMRFSKGELAALRRYMVSQDVNSQTANDYRGQGLLFWSKTASSCVSYRRR